MNSADEVYAQPEQDGITSFIWDDINQPDEGSYSHHLSYLKKNCEKEELMGFGHIFAMLHAIVNKYI